MKVSEVDGLYVRLQRSRDRVQDMTWYGEEGLRRAEEDDEAKPEPTFKVGDRVKLLDPFGSSGIWRKGKVRKIVSYATVEIHWDNGEIAAYVTHRLESDQD